MSGIAVICKSFGYSVSGSDRNSSQQIDFLKSEGIDVHIPHDEKNIDSSIDMVVYTAAIPRDNAELVKAKQLGVRCIERAAFLGKLMERFEIPISIAGTHGKTTTTSMISFLLENNNLMPTYLIGGNFKKIGGNVHVGSDKYLVTEACEYVDSFLNFKSKIGIITNIEEDHLDYFSGIEQIKSSFLKFSNLVQEGGIIIANGDNKNALSTLKDSKTKIVYAGFNENNDYIIRNLCHDVEMYPSFDLENEGNIIGSFSLKVHGDYNVLNAALAILCANKCGVSYEDISRLLPKFSGVNRRFEYKGQIYNNIRIFDDYAHHPTELKSAIKAAREITNGRLYCVFQPHTYTRTKALFDEFKTAFIDADVAIFADIYAAREPFDPSINSKMLSDATQEMGTKSFYFENFEKIEDFLIKELKKDDVLFTIGAGNAYTIGEALIEKYGI